jgi:hypothetical protein
VSRRGPVTSAAACRNRVDRGTTVRNHPLWRSPVEYLLRTRADARVLITSCGRGPGSPLGFYLRQGFRSTGEVHEGELVLELDLPRSPPLG